MPLFNGEGIAESLIAIKHNKENKMTKKELKQKMLDFIGRQDDNVKDEWYGTNYDIYYVIMKEFAKEELGIDLEK